MSRFLTRFPPLHSTLSLLFQFCNFPENFKGIFSGTHKIEETRTKKRSFSVFFCRLSENLFGRFWIYAFEEEMSTSSGTGAVNYRNGTQRSSLRTQSSTSGGQKSSVKSKSVLRKSSPAALGGGSSKSGSGGDAGGKNK